jgi:hypothetical protein
MAMLAFEDDSHFERKAEIAILRFSKKRWPLIVGGETAHCVDAYVKGKVTMDAIPLMFLGEGYQNHNTPQSCSTMIRLFLVFLDHLRYN